MKNKQTKNISPWAWVPTLYFAEGVPYVVAMTVAVIMYKRLGISNADIALYTSWLYLPWVIKPFWSPFVDLIKTKRWWITSMQLLIGAGFAGVAFLIPVLFFFQATLAVLWLIAFSSATHDIAADGFYMLALDSSQQSFLWEFAVLFTVLPDCRSGNSHPLSPELWKAIQGWIRLLFLFNLLLRHLLK
jgi:PAT family beta-lactamase induction signal transducer AmpG